MRTNRRELEGSPGYTPFLGEGSGCCHRPGLFVRRGHPTLGDKPSPQRQEAGRGGRCPGEGRRRSGGGGRGRSYLSTERCRRGSARGPRLRLGCSTRARRRRPGFCSCCGPRRLLEGSGAVSAGDRRPQHPAPPRQSPPPAPRAPAPGSRTHLPGTRRRARSAPPAS